MNAEGTQKRTGHSLRYGAIDGALREWLLIGAPFGRVLLPGSESH